MSKTKPARSGLRLLTLLLLLCLMPTYAHAWSDKAHRIIAGLAWDQLSPEAKTRVKELLGKHKGRDPLTIVANLEADRVKPKNESEMPWHYVPIPLNEDTYLEERDCPRADCVVEKIKEFKKVLEDEKTDKLLRADALMYLTHFVGDLHDPMHCTNHNDKGGTEVLVTFFGRSTSLHKVWDAGLIAQTGLSDEDYVKKLSGMRSPVEGSLDAWLNETHAIARNNAYKIPDNKDLGNAYFSANLPVMEEQLVRAAARLAWMLEGIFKTQPQQQSR